MDFHDRREACTLCGNQPGSDSEYGGQSARGCPSCGATLSPVVSVRNGVIRHNGSKVDMGQGQGGGSLVKLHERGYKAGHYAEHGSSELAVGTGRSQIAAATEAAKAAAAKTGRTFVVRPKETEKRIEAMRKEYGY